VLFTIYSTEATFVFCRRHTEVLKQLLDLLEKEENGRVMDNVVAAVCRMIWTNGEKLPLQHVRIFTRDDLVQSVCMGWWGLIDAKSFVGFDSHSPLLPFRHLPTSPPPTLIVFGWSFGLKPSINKFGVSKQAQPPSMTKSSQY
jgi:hypothetical protein